MLYLKHKDNTLGVLIMDMKQRMTRSAGAPQPSTPKPTQPATPQPQASRQAPIKTSEPKKDKRKKWPFFVILAVIIIGIAGLLIARPFIGVNSQISRDKYQAVFLTNGQVYFGHLSKLESDYYKLSDVYYLQNKSDEKAANEGQLNSNADVQLIKLGNEVHGPEDSMVIERSQVLFFENLKNDGNVVKSIQQYKKD